MNFLNHNSILTNIKPKKTTIGIKAASFKAVFFKQALFKKK